MTDKARNGRTRSPGYVNSPTRLRLFNRNSVDFGQMEVGARGGPRVAEHRLLNP